MERRSGICCSTILDKIENLHLPVCLGSVADEIGTFSSADSLFRTCYLRFLLVDVGYRGTKVTDGAAETE